MKKILSFLLAFSLITSNLFAANLEMDYMEYANDAAAQAEWVSNGANLAIISQTTGASGWGIGASGAIQVREAQSFQLADNTTITGIKAKLLANFGSPSGNVTCRIETNNAGIPSGTLADANLSVAISPTASAWNTWTFATPTLLASGTTFWIVMECDNQADNNYWTWASVTPSAYADGNLCYKSGATWTAYTDYDFAFEVLVTYLQSYSESTIKTQGSYSLKAVADTNALNKTLTRTATIGNLTSVKNLQFDIYSSRTGSNIKIGLVDAGATTEITPNVITANTQQRVNFDLSVVSDANKNAITAIVVTITNADSANTFYIDNFLIAQAIDVFGLVN